MRLAVLNIAVAGALVLAYLEGWLHIFEADETFLSAAIFGVTVFCIGALHLGYRKFAEGFIDQAVELGLIGTVIGFVIAMSGIDAAAAGDVNRISGMVATLLNGMGIALCTTLAGALCRTWLWLALRA